jgi:hypothetical protein
MYIDACMHIYKGVYIYVYLQYVYIYVYTYMYIYVNIGCERMICRPDLSIFLTALHKSRIRAAISTRNCEQAIVKFLNLAVHPAGR